jgi:hypothetical protein
MDGDEGFVGVNMRLHPSLLPPGYASEAINVRFNDGVAETRKGLVKLGWLNRTTVTAELRAILEEGGVPGAILDEGGAAVLEE